MKKILFLCFIILISLELFKIDAKAQETVTIPEDIQQFCIKYGEEYEICPTLLMAMCWHESRCKPNVGTTYKGLTQINQKYFKGAMDLLGVTDLYDAESNIKVCAYTLSKYREDANDVYYVLMCWNSGSTRAKKLFNQGLVTRYAIKVDATSQLLQERMEKDGHY